MRYAIAFLILILAGCGSGGQSHTPTPRPQSSFETNRGARVIVFEGEDPTAEDLIEIDRQISRIIEITNGLDRGYVWPGHPRHVIEIVNPDPECAETPGAFLTNAGQYGGTQICVAGRYYPNTDRIQTTLLSIRSSKVIQYESEHFGLRYNDEALYKDTLTHVPCPPKCHPIFRIE